MGGSIFETCLHSNMCVCHNFAVHPLSCMNIDLLCHENVFYVYTVSYLWSTVSYCYGVIVWENREEIPIYGILLYCDKSTPREHK